MDKKIKLGQIAGLEINAKPAAFAAFFAIWGLLSFLGIAVFKIKPRNVLIGGFIATLLHFVSDLWHHFGHARAADLTGYPMQSVDFWGPIATSVYPQDEGMIAPDIHIQRALGGPIFSLILALVTGLVLLALRPFGGTAVYVAAFLFGDNLLVLTLGALLPLAFIGRQHIDLLAAPPSPKSTAGDPWR